jgi:lysophospholipase L1-like esterase
MASRLFAPRPGRRLRPELGLRRTLGLGVRRPLGLRRTLGLGVRRPLGLRRTLAVGVLAASAFAIAPASALAVHQTYLALGDSLAFGYTQPVFNSLYSASDPAAENPVAFDKGYVDDLGRLLQRYRPGIEVVNDGCPGETTESFINGPCAYQLTYRLHHPYWQGPRTSQLSDAVHYLKTHPGRVSPITVDIGANDVLEVIYGDCAGAPECIASHAEALLGHVASNLHLILRRLRAGAPRARIIVLGLYDPFAASITGVASILARLNAREEADSKSVGARFADPVPVFDPPGALEAPTICRLVGICDYGDIHPTYAGYEALAELLLQRYLSF